MKSTTRWRIGVAIVATAAGVATFLDVQFSFSKVNP